MALQLTCIKGHREDKRRVRLEKYKMSKMKKRVRIRHGFKLWVWIHDVSSVSSQFGSKYVVFVL